MDIQAMERPPTMGPACARYCALILTAAVATAQGATGSETTPFGPAVAGGERRGLAPPTAVPTEATELGLSAGVGETDNVFLSAAPIQSQTLGLLGLDFNLQRESAEFAGDAKGDFQYVDYLQHAYSSLLYGRFDGLATAVLDPGVSKWVFQDDFGQAQINPFEPLTPTNLEYVNVFATGPDFRVRTTDTSFVEASLRYALTHYQTSPLSGNRLLGRLGVGEQLSAASSVSLNVDETRLRFNDTVVNNAVVNTDYDRRELYGRYEARGARTALAMDLGVSQTDERGGWVSAPLAELNVTRVVSPATTLTVIAGHQLTDASDSFRDLKSGASGGIVIAPVAGTTASYLSNYASGELRFELNRTTIAVSSRWERDTYARIHSLDVNTGGVSGSATRRLTPALAAQVVASWQHIHYYNANYYETDWPVGAALIFTPARHVDFKFRVDHVQHNVEGAGVGYTENRALLTVEYWPLR
jgi:hypothetical protein